jgi:hypothetical protein
MGTIQRTGKVLCLVRYEFWRLLYFAHLNCCHFLTLRKNYSMNPNLTPMSKLSFVCVVHRFWALHPKYIMDSVCRTLNILHPFT